MLIAIEQFSFNNSNSNITKAKNISKQKLIKLVFSVIYTLIICGFMD